MILLSRAKLQKNTWTIYKFSTNFMMQNISMKLSKCHFFTKEIQYLGHILSSAGIKPQPSRMAAIKLMKLPKNAKQVRAFPGLVGYYHRFIRNFAWMAKPLTALIHHDAKFAWTSGHHKAFSTLKSTLLEAPILHYSDPSKPYKMCTGASDDACGAQLSQEHDGQELPIAFLSHMLTDTQQKWGTTAQEAYGIYYAVTKWNYCLPGSDIVLCNDHKPVQKFLNGKKSKQQSKQLVIGTCHL